MDVCCLLPLRLSAYLPNWLAYDIPQSLAPPGLRHLVLDAQFVRHHRDELAVRRLRFGDVDGVAEQVADRLDVATRPGDLDGVADGAFDTGRGRLEFLGDGRVQRLGNGAEDLDVVVYHRDRFAQILVALDVRRNADFVDDAGDVGVEVAVFVHRNDVGPRGAGRQGRSDRSGAEKPCKIKSFRGLQHENS